MSSWSGCSPWKCGAGAGGSGNLANDAVAAALAYRAQAPVLDGLMKELGLDGSSLGKLVEGAANGHADQMPDLSDEDGTPSLFEKDGGDEVEAAE